MIVIPGSRETDLSRGVDEPRGMLANVTRNFWLYNRETLRVHWIPYPAQINEGARNVYGQSRRVGYFAAYDAIRTYADRCKNTKFVLLGYSQGAHIAGDLTATIGREGIKNVGVERLTATALLGDAARWSGFRPLVGMSYNGGNGIDGSRTFGRADSRVVEYCVAHDPICDFGGYRNYGRAVAEAFRSSGPHVNYHRLDVPGTRTKFTDRIAYDLRAKF